MGWFCLFGDLHQEGFASAACAEGWFSLYIEREENNDLICIGFYLAKDWNLKIYYLEPQTLVGLFANVVFSFISDNSWNTFSQYKWILVWKINVLHLNVKYVGEKTFDQKVCIFCIFVFFYIS